MKLTHPFWKEKAFTFTIYACVAFVILTTIGMAAFPGGYIFSQNYFSEIGMWIVKTDVPNPIGAVVFFVGLTGAGLGLISYFIGLTQLFTQTSAQIVLVRTSALIGLASGISFIGIALTPANFNNLLPYHSLFVNWAFRLFLFAVIFQMLAMFINPNYPNKYGFLNLGFAVLLAGYVWLLIAKPAIGDIDIRSVQVGGQKIIAYASVLTALLQAQGAKVLIRE